MDDLSAISLAFYDQLNTVKSSSEIHSCLRLHLKKHLHYRNVYIFIDSEGYFEATIERKLCVIEKRDLDLVFDNNDLQAISPKLSERIRTACPSFCHLRSRVTCFMSADHDCAGFLVLVNKSKSSRFDDFHARVLDVTVRQVLPVLNLMMKLEFQRMLTEESANLSMVARNIFYKMDDGITVLLKQIMHSIKYITNSERCSLFLVDGETLNGTVFDGNDLSKSPISLNTDQGIVGHVATTGLSVITNDPYNHPNFCREMDMSTGFVTRNILCIPINDEKGKVVAVAELCNKNVAGGFTERDIHVAQKFGLFCGIGIRHSLVYEQANDLILKNKLANEMIIYHKTKGLKSELEKYDDCEFGPVTAVESEFGAATFPARMYNEDKSVTATLGMFEEVGLISDFRINRNTLVKFCLLVKSGYRDVPYHNWTHAFSATQFMFAINKAKKLTNYIDTLELFSLFVACLCHDIDHRGTNNNFLTASSSILASLYSSEGSLLERHHIAQAFGILSLDGCNVFSNLSREEYNKAVYLIEDNILATDLGNHFKMLDSIDAITRTYDRRVKKNRQLFLGLVMTSCDLNDSIRPWEVAKISAAMVYQEFFKQGDMERQMGNVPIDLMNREKSDDIPVQQIGFFDHVVLPVCRSLGLLIPEFRESLEQAKINRDSWDHIRVMTMHTSIVVMDRKMTIKDGGEEIDTLFQT